MKRGLQILVPLIGVAGFGFVIAAIWAPYGAYPQGQLAWTGVALLCATFFAAPLAFI